MNAIEALESLQKGNKVRTKFDGEDIYYRKFEFDTIARMMTKSFCTAEVIKRFTPEEFLASVDGIEMIEIKI